MTKIHYAELTELFEAHDLQNTAFRHPEHIAVAYQMLGKYQFDEAVSRYAENIKIIATRAGAPDKFHSTITFAFMGLVAERMETTKHDSYEEFISRNDDLLSKSILQRWYSPERINSELARKIFLLPDLVQTAGI